MVLNHAEFTKLSGAFRPSWFAALRTSRSLLELGACALWRKSIPVAQDLSVMDLELRLPAWILIPNNGKRLSLKGTRKKICPARNELAFTVLRLYGFPSTDFSGFCVKKVSTWLTILPAPWFQVRLEFFSPSSTLKSNVNGSFIL